MLVVHTGSQNIFIIKNKHQKNILKKKKIDVYV